MRDYSIVLPEFWTRGTGKALRDDPDSQRVALYLMTSPHNHMTGLFYLPLPTLAHEVGSISLEGASKALARLIAEGFLHLDPADDLLFVVNMAAIQIGRRLEPRDNRIKAIAKHLEKFKKHEFYRLFLDRYRDLYHLTATVLGEGPQRPSRAPSKPLRSQDQDQDQEQDQEQDDFVVSEAPVPRASNGASQPTETTTTTNGVLRTLREVKPSSTISASDVERIFAEAAGKSDWPMHAHAEDYEWLAAVCAEKADPIGFAIAVCTAFWRHDSWADKNRSKVKPRSLVRSFNHVRQEVSGVREGETEELREYRQARAALREARERHASEDELKPLKQRMNDAARKGTSNGRASTR